MRALAPVQLRGLALGLGQFGAAAEEVRRELAAALLHNAHQQPEAEIAHDADESFRVQETAARSAEVHSW